MKTLLLFPPQAHPTQPALCLPSLTAWLRAQGFPDTHQWDVNVDAHEHFLSRERLALSRERVRQEYEQLPRNQALDLRLMDRFRVLAEAVASADSVVDGIDDALDLIRDPARFYDHDRYLQAVKLLDRGFRLISAEYHPTSLTPHNFTTPHSIERLSDVLNALEDEESNLFLEYFREHTVPAILDQAPDLLGISLTYTSQVIPGLTLARLVKQARPDIHITVGGGLLAYLGDKLTQDAGLFDLIDSLIVLEGEGPLLELARAVERGTGLSSVPNCYHRENGEVVVSDAASPLPIDDLPTPEFDGLPMDRYLSPQLALPLAITRGCYWEKCAFCTLYKVIGPGFRQRSMDKVMDDIEDVTRRWGSNVVYFIVEDMPPPVFKVLPGALKSRDLDIRWWTDARLEKNLFTPELCRDLYDAGCRRIAFGFESSSERVLELMEKGIGLEDADTILRRLSEAGISNTLYTMLGFPTETREEAEGTLAWLRAHKDVVHEVSLRIFYIDHLSKVYANPEHYQIESILEDPDKDLQVYYDWVPGAGMSRREARELFFEFMKVIREEFPLFRGDNLRLFELKSHYFLYLCRFGDLSFLEHQDQVQVGEAVPADLGRAVPALPEGNSCLALSHDLRDISQRLNEAECSMLRPRYMSGSFKEQLFEEMDRQVPPAEPKETYAVYRARSGDLLHLGRDAAAILARCDGQRTVAEILEPWPAAVRPRLEDFLRTLFAQGLLTVEQARSGRAPGAPVAPGSSVDVGIGPASAEPVRAAEAMHLYCRPSTG